MDILELHVLLNRSKLLPYLWAAFGVVVTKNLPKSHPFGFILTGQLRDLDCERRNVVYLKICGEKFIIVQLISMTLYKGVEIKYFEMSTFSLSLIKAKIKSSFLRWLEILDIMYPVKTDKLINQKGSPVLKTHQYISATYLLHWDDIFCRSEFTWNSWGV